MGRTVLIQGMHASGLPRYLLRFCFIDINNSADSADIAEVHQLKSTLHFKTLLHCVHV